MSGVPRFSSENDPPGRSSDNDPPRRPPGRSPGRSVLSPRSDKPVFQYRRWLNQLNKIFDDVYFVESPYMDPAVYGQYSITCKPLGIADDGNYVTRPQPCFFAPLSRQGLDSHPIDFDFRDEISDDIRHELDLSAKVLTKLAEHGRDPLGSALFPGNHLSWLSGRCSRINFPEPGESLTSLTPWFTW